MHIAICDDNVADRKQLERLLGRESDKRKADTGVFYTDSFGDSNALSKNPMPYDLFFLDIISGSEDGFAFALKLRSIGVTAPIVLCSSKINYLSRITSAESASEFMHLNKPIMASELCQVLDKAIQMQQSRVPTIELRSEKDTYYVKEDDIVYAVSEGLHVHVFLNNGTKIPVIASMENFYHSVSMYSHMLMLTNKSLINIAYLDKILPTKVILKDGTAIKSSPFSQKYIKSALQEYLAEQP